MFHSELRARTTLMIWVGPQTPKRIDDKIYMTKDLLMMIVCFNWFLKLRLFIFNSCRCSCNQINNNNIKNRLNKVEINIRIELFLPQVFVVTRWFYHLWLNTANSILCYLTGHLVVVIDIQLSLLLLLHKISLYLSLIFNL